MDHREAPSISNAMGLQSLLDEPVRLAAEADRLNAELEALVMDNYKVFVENLTCSVHLKIEDKKLGEISHELESHLHELSQQCTTFKDRVNHFVGSHKRNRKTLQHHMQLVELLEVPQLVDACARNGFHDEALELANFVNGLERRHLLASEVKSTNGKLRGGSGVIQTIVNDVHQTLAGLRQQLLLQLTENTTLPKEITILATLRKLDGLLIDRHISQGRYDGAEDVASASAVNVGAAVQQQREAKRLALAQNFEVRLQMDFLEARTVWLLNCAERALHLPRSDNNKTAAGDEGATARNATSTSTALPGTSKAALGPYGQVSEMLEIRRTAWFAVITQFNALFRDNQSGTTQPSRGRNGATADGAALDVPAFGACAVLSAWATRQVNQLLRELQVQLPQIEDGASLRSVLEQTLFFASRMSQVGCDFSGLAIPVFHDVLCHRFVSEVQRTAQSFKNILLTERVAFESSNGDTTAREQIIPLYAAQDAPTSGDSTDAAVPASNGTGSGDAVGELAAPQLLMRFPPLAYLLNSLLTHMNLLRECPLVTTEAPALEAVFALFEELGAYVVSKSTEVRKLGEKYLSTLKGQDKLKKSTSGEADGKSEPLDRMYAQAMAQELLPHVLICFESIFASNPTRLETKLRAVRARDQRRTATGNSRALACLVNNLHDAKDLFEAEAVDRLEKVWAVLVQGGLLPEGALSRSAPAPPAVPSASAVRSAPVTAPVVSAAAVAGGVESSEDMNGSDGASTVSVPAREKSRDTSKDD